MIKRATVYRVQDKYGRGPFKPGFTKEWIDPKIDRTGLLPWFMEFHGSLDPESTHACACTSKDQLKRWFSASEMTALEKLGYQPVKIDKVVLVYTGDNQCLFKTKKRISKLGKPFKLYCD